jgi:hypothetical protein
MPKTANIDDIAERNPKVNVAQVRETQRLLDTLGEGGEPTYDVVSPYARKPMHKPDRKPPRLGR